MRPGLISVCGKPGCGNARPCATHPAVSQKQERSIEGAERHRFYKSAIWVRLRAWFLSISPEDYPDYRCGLLCWACKEHGIIRAATDVDHIIPIQDGGSKTDPMNLQSLCRSCHASKTRTEMNKRRSA